MGGIAGLVHFRGDAPDAQDVRRMSARLAHRGPAGSGEWAEGMASVAHHRRRLGPRSSVQPAVADDVVVLLDGWIYDHDVLAHAADDGPPAEFDVDALIRAWRRWGPGTFEHLEGEFALALWDRKAQQLHLVRDRLGVRPLFWARRGERVAFASEVPALLELPWVRRDIERTHLAEYLSFQVVHAPRTLLEDVQQVPPAHHLCLGAGTEHLRRWWRLQYAPPGAPRPPEGEVVDRVQEAVSRAVRRRVPRGIPTGLYLSGGLGSTAIAAAAREHFLQLPSFTVSFSDDLYPELPFAGRVAGLLGLEHHEVEVGTSELAAGFDEAVAALGHPVGHPGVVLQMALARATREQVSVALAGDGAEELFGGRMLDRLGRAQALGRVVGRLPRVVSGPVGRFTGVRDPTKASVDWVLDQEFGGHRLFDADERGRLLRDHGLVRPQIRRSVLRTFYDDLNTDAVNAALHGSLCSWLSESDLVRADRTAAAAGLDLRLPLLDREVLEAAAALPGSAKIRRMRGLHTRWPLRAMVSGTLPQALLNRPKRGLPKPLDTWLEGPGRLFMEERFARLRSDPLGLWRPEGLDALRRELARTPGTGIRLWTLFVLDAWLHKTVLA